MLDLDKLFPHPLESPEMKTLQPGSPFCVLYLLTLAITVGMSLYETRPAAADDAGAASLDPETIYRYDAVLERLRSVPKAELKVGSVYCFYSSRHGRHVWSFRLENDQFWHAFGEGTTQIARRFDLRQTRSEAINELRRRNPALAERVDRSLQPIRLRLDAQNKWIEIGSHEVESIYDLETRQRWENHTGRYVPVRATYGSRWSVRDGHYVSQ